MKVLLKKENLFLRVAVGFVLGVILGLTAKDFSIATKVVGDLYLNLIKLMIIPIVVCAVFLRHRQTSKTATSCGVSACGPWRCTW